jgi:hypothetical protein
MLMFTCQQKPSTRSQAEKQLPTLTFEILNVLGFIQNQILPSFLLECSNILGGQLVRCDADMERVGFCPSLNYWVNRAPFNIKRLVEIGLTFRLSARSFAVPK